jgi:hypothetical protein
MSRSTSRNSTFTGDNQDYLAYICLILAPGCMAGKL